MSGQDGEAEAELLATIKGDHIKMKEWYNGPSKEAESVRGRFGSTYPAFWRQVISWPGWKDSRKAYLQYVQKKESSNGGNSSNIPRKRPSRWSSADSNSGNNNNNNSNEPPRRKSRWGREAAAAPPPPAPALSRYAPQQPGRTSTVLDLLPGMIPGNLTPQQDAKMKDLQARLRDVNHKLSNIDAEAARVDSLPRGHRDRSPSPPPIYGADGKRKNTRAVRWRERYTNERQNYLDELMALNPALRGSMKRKKQVKVPIPVEQHPTYNFIGLIIGPRGKTQKEMEAKTGCKIAIRGRGSVKEGARGRRDGKVLEGDDEPLHVVISGDDPKSVDAAAEMIRQMLVVMDDEKNVHKQQQLRELALLNGTLKDEEFCPICAEKGHRAFECPKRFQQQGGITAGVKCAICGDTSHPTRDCTQQKPAANAPSEQKDTKQLDSDYLSFMAELDGKKAPDAAAGALGAAPGAPAVANGGTSAAPGTAAPAASASGVTILQPAAPATPTGTGITIIKPADKVAGATTDGGTGTVPLPPPPPPTGMVPPMGLPPPPNMSVPPPPGVAPPPLSGVPPPPPMPPAGGVLPPPPMPPGQQQPQQPPPPSAAPYTAPPPPHAGYHQQPPPHHPGQSYYGNHQQAPSQYNNMAYNNNNQQQRKQAQGGSDETEGWDYRSFYGGGSGAGNAGAGGFNWWEQSG